MGLSASQARYLFISARMNDLEAGMLTLSAQQLRLKDQASDIEERRDYELNLLELQFNGNANFTYDDFMGENAINNGQIYFLTTNDGNNRVVLNQKYANGMQAAGIAEEGGNATLDAEVNFMNAVAGKPKKANDWKEVITGNLTDTSAYAPIDKFKSEYGAAAPQQGKDPNKEIKGTENYTTYSYMSASDFAGMLSGNANLNPEMSKKTGINGMLENAFIIQSENRSDAGFINNKDNTTWKNIINSQNTVLYLGEHKTKSYDESYIPKTVQTIISNLGSQVKSAGIDSSAVDKAVKNTQSKYSTIKDVNSGSATTAKNTAGIAKHQTRDSGTFKHSKYEYSVDLKGVFEYFYNQLQSALGSAKEGNKLSVGTQASREVVVDHEPYRNSNGKTYEEWNSAWNQVVSDNNLDASKAKEYLTSGHVKVAVAEEDTQTFNNYYQIFLKACTNGWTQDNDLNNTANLSSKLENMQYKVNNEVIKNLKDNFASVKANEEAVVKSRYDKALKEVERQEKAIDIEQTAKQTELNALQTELSSVQSIIDKNVERSFNLFG